MLMFPLFDYSFYNIMYWSYFQAILASYWAIPEIRCTPPKEDMGILKILTTVFIGKSPKIKHFFACKGKEDMEIPKMFNHF